MLTSTSFDAAASASEAVAFVHTSAPVAVQPARAPMPAAFRPSRNDEALADVLRHPGIWRRGTKPASTSTAQSTGFAALDALLPGGGWPRGALSEILIGEDGLGECSLVLPALAALTQARRRVALIGPPYVPYAPAMVEAGIDLSQLVHIDAGATDTHWTAEQCLRAGCCGAVLNWLPRADYQQLRRLQLAAETGAAIGFVFRPLSAASQASPAALRLSISASSDGPRIDILKCRGRLGDTSTAIRLRA
ncbi:MAG: translesion DNA synthesis-associated protein ImuA [Dokdonella sp.]|uniref:translesion DNA synthesis-associated protein ImuA n=1 Tax=Dokdonella sp. TaxID=2291710 RepID=UPI003265B8B2